MAHPDDFLETSHPHLAEGAGRDRLHVRWLGTAGYELRAGDTTVLIDPYLTRVGLWRFLTRPIAPDVAAIDAAISGPVDAILVGHSHFDHVMDVPYIAKKTGAIVYGSQSTANLMAAAGVPEAQVVALEHRRKTFGVGPFEITAVPSVHSPFALGGKVPYAGEIPCTCELPVRGKHYKCGDVFSYHLRVDGRTAYHLGSANFIADELVDREVDLLMVCIAARFATPGFVPDALSRLEPRVVMPMHYDNFFRGADKPMKLLPRTRFGRFVDDVSGVDKDMTVRTLPLNGALTLR